MALFAVPAQKAVEAGIGMFHSLMEFNHNLDLNGQPIIAAGIGINTGPLVLGTIGANDRMQCSVLGDTVNLASRIEQLTRAYDAPFLIGENTYLSLARPDAFSIRMIDCVAVKGKAVAVKLYEVLDVENKERRAAKEATRDLLNEALDAYFARNFSKASKILSLSLIHISEPTRPY